ncbi:MAG: ATP-binding protein [Propionibacteriales bacterium]|nr:ATP-binding protein [Propionibacteriales bacterium]
MLPAEIESWLATLTERPANLIVDGNDSGRRTDVLDQVEAKILALGTEALRVPYGQLAAASGRDARLLQAALSGDPWSEAVARQARQSEVLIVDDFAVGEASYDEVYGVFTVVDERSQHLRPIALATPYSRDEIFHLLNANEQEAVLAEKVVSRLFHDAVVVTIP